MQDFVGVKGVLSPEGLRSSASAVTGRPWSSSPVTGVICRKQLGTFNILGNVVEFAAVLLQGVLLNFLYAPTHECDHLTAFKSRWLNIGSPGYGVCDLQSQ
ncbi:MAG: hypothetical protein CM1200mP20_03570 [Pseudomonadota bacterium]|nr:MAG: hypothetical protein CM1200mP20_03570 [Pseudomonadota bacterium]